MILQHKLSIKSAKTISSILLSFMGVLFGCLLIWTITTIRNTALAAEPLPVAVVTESKWLTPELMLGIITTVTTGVMGMFTLYLRLFVGNAFAMNNLNLMEKIKEEFANRENTKLQIANLERQLQSLDQRVNINSGIIGARRREEGDL